MEVPGRNRDRVPIFVALVQDLERGSAFGVDCVDLRGAQRTADVALTEWPA
jgi:hypothetical protein